MRNFTVVSLLLASILFSTFSQPHSAESAFFQTTPAQIEIANQSGVSGYNIGIFGTNFGATTGTVEILGVSAPIVTWEDTFIQATVPTVADGTATDGLTIITDDGRVVSAEFTVYTIHPAFLAHPTTTYKNIARGRTAYVQGLQSNFCLVDNITTQPEQFLTDFRCNYQGVIGPGSATFAADNRAPYNSVASVAIKLDTSLDGDYTFQFFTNNNWYERGPGYSFVSSYPEDYRIQLSADSTDGVDGTWADVATIIGNKRSSRLNTFSASAVDNYTWVRMYVTHGVADQSSYGTGEHDFALREIRLYEAQMSDMSRPDSFAVYGDSLTADAFEIVSHQGVGQKIQALRGTDVESIFTSYGLSGQNSSGLVDSVLTNHDIYDALALDNSSSRTRYWGIALGTNDAADGSGAINTPYTNIYEFPARLDAFLQDMIAQGLVPIIHRIPDTDEADNGTGDLLSKAKILADIDAAAATYQLIPGPDLYTAYRRNLESDGGSWFRPGDGTHHTSQGKLAMVSLWADAFAAGVPYNPTVDSDNDGQSDADELACGSNPNDDQDTSLDTDLDNVPDCVDIDDDNDGVEDLDDAFPLDAAEWADTDGDGTGNNADADDDGDGQSDVDELLCESDPLDDQDLAADLDNDGSPDCTDGDDDGDSQPDVDEIACGSDPRDASSVSTDFDNDYTLDCLDPDDDNDGVDDVDDLFPYDSTEWADADGDGTGDNADLDDDNDLQLDADELACGSDPLDDEDLATDTDGDNRPDCVDADDDNDGVDDIDDAFPLDSTEWADTDGDGTGDNADLDDDNDLQLDDDELACGSDPLDADSKSADSDNDNIPDCVDLETALVTMSVDLTASPTELPSEGGWVEFEVVVTNTSSSDQAAHPIQLNQYASTLFGSIAPTTAVYTNTCWWWLPSLGPGESWTCSYNILVTDDSQPEQITVTSTPSGLPSITASDTASITLIEGSGVLSIDDILNGDVQTVQAASRTSEMLNWQWIDTDRDQIPDAEGILIGDSNMDATCDIYEVWWTQKCIALTRAEVMTLLEDSNHTDQRIVLLSQMSATWLNILNHNNYLCANMDVALNLGMLWLYDRNAPNGNPYNGGAPVPVHSHHWRSFSWDHSWLQWYNETGGGCALDATPGRNTIDIASFDPLDSIMIQERFAATERAEIERVLRLNPALQAEINALYTQVAMLVMTDGVISAEFITAATTQYNALLAAVQAEADSDDALATNAAARLETVWAEANIAQYEGQSARSAWGAFNTIGEVTAVTLSTLSSTATHAPSGAVLLAALLVLSTGTRAVLRRQR